jgi:tetratricopeptide (TPR) repeat protein
VRQLKLANLLNLSACYLRLDRYSDCMLACSAVLELDGDNVKALFRRAQARSTAVSSGTTDHMKAAQDLKRAYSLSPGNREVVRSFVNLKSSLVAQRQKDRRVLHNVFDREQGDKEGMGGRGSCREQVVNEEKRHLTWYDRACRVNGCKLTDAYCANIQVRCVSGSERHGGRSGAPLGRW